MDNAEWVMATTVDADVHLFRSNVDLMRMKVSNNQWLLTTDGHYVKGDKVVSLWVPSEEELQGWTEALNG